MRVLVIFCHPAADSFAAALCKAAVETLGAAGHETRLTDLLELVCKAAIHPTPNVRLIAANALGAIGKVTS